MLLPLLAQSAPPADFGPWLANLMYLCGAFAALAVAWRHLRGKPNSTTIAEQPVQVSPAVKYIEEPRYERDQAAIQKELSRQAARRAEFYEKVEAMGHDIAALKADSQSQAESLSSVATEAKATTSKVDQAVGEMKLLNQQVTLLITNTVRK